MGQHSYFGGIDTNRTSPSTACQHDAPIGSSCEKLLYQAGFLQFGASGFDGDIFPKTIMYPTKKEENPMTWYYGTDVDDIRPVGIDQTGVDWVLIAVPEPCASIASRHVGGVAYAELPRKKAVELLRNETWRLLNPDAVQRLVPDLVPPVDPEPVVLDERDALVLEAVEKQQRQRRRIEEELRADPKRTDRIIAELVGADRSTVGLRRRKMERAGEIQRIHPDERAHRPRPAQYRTRRRRR